MNAEFAAVFPAVTLFVFSLVLTAASLWLGARMAPWFLRERFDPPSVRSYFFDPAAERDLTETRVVTMLLGVAVLLAALLALAVAVKFGGLALL